MFSYFVIAIINLVKAIWQRQFSSDNDVIEVLFINCVILVTVLV